MTLLRFLMSENLYFRLGIGRFDPLLESEGFFTSDSRKDFLWASFSFSFKSCFSSAAHGITFLYQTSQSSFAL